MSASREVQTYASVAFEAALKDWVASLASLVTAFARSPGLQSKLADQSLSFESRSNMLLSLLPDGDRVPGPVRNFLLGMLANGDITLADEVLEELNHMAAAGGGPRPTLAEITSAVELAAEERLAIQNRLVDQFGPNLEFKFLVKPSILGGLVVRVGDKLMDSSVSTRLSALRQSLGVAG